MNILFINNVPFNPSFGGIERVTDNLTRALQQKGYNVFYLSWCLADIKYMDYNFPVPQYIMPNAETFAAVENMIFYKRLILIHQIDVVVNQRGINSHVDELLEVSNVKKVSVLHSCPLSLLYESIYKTLYHSTNRKEQLKYILKVILYPLVLMRKRHKLMKELRAHYDYICKHSDAVCVLSEKYIGELQRCMSYTARNIYAIADPNTYPLQKVDYNDKKKEILYVGRLYRSEKNPLRLLKIWRRLYLDYPDWKLVIVGDGEEKNRMRMYAKKHHIENVNFKGVQANVAKYYRSASFVCLTSNFEGFGMVLCEGMTYGCVPFTFNNYAAASEIIDDNVNGCLIKPFSIKQYAKRLATLMMDEDRRQIMAKAAQLKVTCFDMNHIVDKWDLLFKSL